MHRMLIVIAVTCTFYGVIYATPVKELQLEYLRQETVPSIDYKYVIKTLLPQQDSWWKRGTHHFYVNNVDTKTIDA
ncbi:unnamed protein product [Tenebrio molitor]|nr:unnamed protein product [Tenebrio molitor]